MKPLIEYMLIKYSLTLREFSIMSPMMEKENSMHTMSDPVPAAEKNTNCFPHQELQQVWLRC